MANIPSIRNSQSPEFRRGLRNPIQAMVEMQREMDQLFDTFFGMPVVNTEAFRSQNDLEDAGSHYILSADMPGLSKEDVNIEVQDNALHVWGERKQEPKEKSGTKERFYGFYDRWLALPQQVKAEDIEAHLENGVLRIAIPKAEESKAKRVRIGEGKSGFFTKLLGRSESGDRKAS